MRLLLTFIRRSPAKSLVTVLALFFAGVAEGFGLTMLLPLLSIAVDVSGGSAGGPHPSSTLSKLVTGFMESTGLTPTTNVLLLLFVVSLVVKACLVLMANRRVGYMVAQLATDLRMALIRALFASRWEYFVRQPVGKFTNAYATKANRSAQAYQYGIRVMAFLMHSLVYTVVAFLLSWRTTLVALTAGSLLLYALRLLVTRAKQAGRSQTNLLRSLLSVLTDTLQAIKPLKAMARDDMAILVLQKKTESLNRALKSQVFNAEALKALQEPLLTTFFAVGLYVVLVWWKQPLSTVLVMTYLLAKILKTLQKAQKEYQSMVIAESAYWSICAKTEAAQKEKEVSTGTIPPRFEWTVRLEEVTFSYESGGQPVLKGVSLDFPKGSFTAIVGPSGVGKTTIIDLITGLLVPQQGVVRIDDVPLPEIDLRAWRQMIGYVPQETTLLHDTVFLNVTLGDPAFTEEDTERALRDAGAWGFVSELPDGVRTVVGERGARLSGGQRQRIMVARALVHQPRLLILDEATSALDPESEAAICEALSELRRRRGLTIIAISHQERMLMVADRTYRLSEGVARLVEEGRHSGLDESVSLAR